MVCKLENKVSEYHNQKKGGTANSMKKMLLNNASLKVSSFQ